MEKKWSGRVRSWWLFPTKWKQKAIITSVHPSNFFFVGIRKLSSFFSNIMALVHHAHSPPTHMHKCPITGKSTFSAIFVHLPQLWKADRHPAVWCCLLRVGGETQYPKADSPLCLA